MFFAQEDISNHVVDSLYREDQFYINITYNSLKNSPNGLAQNGFSPGLSFGFLRDFPLNDSRDIAIAPGFGFSLSGLNQNLLIQENNDNYTYSILNENEFDRNRLSLYMVDLPIELRWRTSTPDSHKFWRIYLGIKMSYIFYNYSKSIINDDTKTITNIEDIKNFQASTYLTFGFNTWNFYMLYGLTPIFNENVFTENQSLKTSMLNIGLQFYIL
jgi:hypothetical protein